VDAVAKDTGARGRAPLVKTVSKMQTQGIEAPGDAKHVSSNDMDYAKFVLYVRPGLPSCEPALRKAAQCQDIIVQDVDKIKGPRPAWLRGVPTLVAVPSFALLTGLPAIRALDEHVNGGVQGLTMGLVPGGTSVGAPLSEDEVGGAATQFRIPTIHSEERYEDAPKDKNHGGTTLEEMLRRRASSGRAA
jgi:hypothetical protein